MTTHLPQPREGRPSWHYVRAACDRPAYVGAAAAAAAVYAVPVRCACGWEHTAYTLSAQAEQLDEAVNAAWLLHAQQHRQQ